VQESAIQILDSHRTMAISTLRPDGWPQTTIVGYANDGLTLYFLIFRSSQKLANIRRDRRVSLAVGGDSKDLSQLTAVYAAAHAIEVTEQDERARAWRLLVSRHPNLIEFELPERSDAALMKAACQYVTVLDYRKGPGHTEDLSIGDGNTAPAHDARTEDWGSSAVKPGRLGRKKIPE
jgi:nitroimidazol reductase NimA-like FMN-containing flavoprotein (pyridoxamine 5'-phosphate oxidase superfamily)